MVDVNGQLYCRCVVRYDGSQHGKVREIRIPVTSKASFEEVLDNDEDSGKHAVSVDQLARLLHGASTINKLLVQLREPTDDLVAPSDDDHDLDLPRDTDITLAAVVDEPCVLASVDSASRPAFHLPLRTDVDVRLVKYLDRVDSPFLVSRQRPRLSTMDRCVEPLYGDALTAFMTSSRRDLTATNGNTSVSTHTHPRSRMSGYGSPPLGSRGKAPVEGLWDKCPQKLVMFCKLYYSDVIWKKAKQYRFVFQQLPEPNRACLVGVW